MEICSLADGRFATLWLPKGRLQENAKEISRPDFTKVFKKQQTT